MEIFISWLVLSIIVGILADQRGRNGIGWGFLAGLISPLLAGIILFIIPNVKEEEEKFDRLLQEQKVAKRKRIKEEQEKIDNALKITGADFLLSMDKLHQLYVKNILSVIEYEARKLKLFEELSIRIIGEAPENFLGNIVPLLDQKILSIEEMQKIKEIVFK